MNNSKIIDNAKWIVACKLMQSALQLVVGVLSARYLGPSNYGLINYAASIVAFAIPFMRLGFDATLVREYVEFPDNEREIAGTSLILNLLSATFCVFGVVGFSAASNADDSTTVVVCVLYSLSLVFGAAEMVQYWFQYKLLSKYSSIIMLISYIVVSAYRIFLLVAGKNIYWFAVVHSIEYGLVAIFLLIVYFKKGGKLAFSFAVAKRMLCNSKHYIIAALMLVIIQNTDHIMLTNMISESENGLYSAAINSASVLQFVYSAVIDSYRPVILANKKDGSDEYCLNITRLYSVTIYLSFAQSLAFTVFSDLIIRLLYGSEFAGSAAVLRILVWFLAFSTMGSVRNVWILAEQKQKYLWIINISGAAVNILLNAVLIRPMGACGAALASLITQVAANFVLGFVWKPLRDNNHLIVKSLNPRFAYTEIKKMAFAVVKKKGG